MSQQVCKESNKSLCGEVVLISVVTEGLVQSYITALDMADKNLTCDNTS